MTKDETWPEAAHRMYLEQVDAVTKRLRDLADEVERKGKDLRNTFTNDCGAHTYAAGQVVHAIAWGLANTHVDSLVKYAGSADAAVTTDDGGET